MVENDVFIDRSWAPFPAWLILARPKLSGGAPEDAERRIPDYRCCGSAPVTGVVLRESRSA